MPAPTLFKIRYFGNPAEELVDLAEAQRLLDFEGRVILVEGMRVQSYAELANLSARAENKDKEYLEVVVLPTVMGG
jgi:hypothetical protein